MQWPFAVAELPLGKALVPPGVHMHRRDKDPVEVGDDRDLAPRGWRSSLVDAGILDPDTAPGGIVMGRTAEEGGTAMARIVQEGDIGRHGPGQVVEGKKSADTMKLSATGATTKALRFEGRDSTYWVGSLIIRIVPLGGSRVPRISRISRILTIWITLTIRVVIVGIARHL